MTETCNIEKVAEEIAEKALLSDGDYFHLINCELKKRGITESRGIILSEVGRRITQKKKAAEISQAV